MSSHHCRMVIGECLNVAQVKAFADIYAGAEKQLAMETGCVRSELLIEEGGNMVVALTTWETREDCLRYHSSRSYRQFVAKTQHMLVGNFVIKIFKVAVVTGAAAQARPMVSREAVEAQVEYYRDGVPDDVPESVRWAKIDVLQWVLGDCSCDGTITDPADVDCPQHGRPQKFTDPQTIADEIKRGDSHITQTVGCRDCGQTFIHDLGCEQLRYQTGDAVIAE